MIIEGGAAWHESVAPLESHATAAAEQREKARVGAPGADGRLVANLVNRFIASPHSPPPAREDVARGRAWRWQSTLGDVLRMARAAHSRIEGFIFPSIFLCCFNDGRVCARLGRVMGNGVSLWLSFLWRAWMCLMYLEGWKYFCEFSERPEDRVFYFLLRVCQVIEVQLMRSVCTGWEKIQFVRWTR